MPFTHARPCAALCKPPGLLQERCHSPSSSRDKVAEERDSRGAGVRRDREGEGSGLHGRRERRRGSDLSKARRSPRQWRSLRGGRGLRPRKGVIIKSMMTCARNSRRPKHHLSLPCMWKREAIAERGPMVGMPLYLQAQRARRRRLACRAGMRPVS